MNAPVSVSEACDRVALDLVCDWILAGQHDRAAHFLNGYLDPDHSSGVSTTPVTVSTFGDGGTQDSDLKAPSGPGASVEPAPPSGVAAPESCTPDEDLYRELLGEQVEGPEACGHTWGRLVCARGTHPFNPRGHMYLNLTGSEVEDRHTEAADL